MRLTRKTNLAARVLSACAMNEGIALRSADIANTCQLPDTCRLRTYVDRAVEAFDHKMDVVMLEDLTRGNCGFAALLAVPENLRRSCAEVALA